MQWEEAALHRLYLLRHAKAAWAAPGSTDFDRPLSGEGWVQCAALGTEMLGAGHLPRTVLCSSARRARETWEGIAPALGVSAPQPHYTAELYHGDEEQALMLIRGESGAGPLLLVGHNPTFETLANALVGSGDSRTMRALRSGFPQAALAAIDFDETYSAVGPGRGRLSAFIVPAV